MPHRITQSALHSSLLIAACLMLSCDDSESSEHRRTDSATDAFVEDAHVVPSSLDGGPGVQLAIESVALDKLSFELQLDNMSKEDLVPFVLFRDQSACLDITLLTQAGDVATHKAENPRLWTRWRRNADGRVERLLGGVWTAVAFIGEYQPLPRGTRFNLQIARETSKQFSATSFSFVEARYQFHTDGTFVMCHYDKLQAGMATGPSVDGTDRSGTYEIDGYRLHLKFSGGDSVTVPFVYSSSSTFTQAWIGHYWYNIEKVGSSARGLCSMQIR